MPTGVEKSLSRLIIPSCTLYTVQYPFWQALEELSCRTGDLKLPLGLEAESNIAESCSLHNTERPVSVKLLYYVVLYSDNLEYYIKGRGT